MAQVLLRHGERESEVLAVQRDWTVEWRAGIPSLGAAAEAFRAQKIEVFWGKAWAFRKENLDMGRVYDWTFDGRALRGPLRDAAASCGWGWRPVVFSKLRRMLGCAS